MSVVIDRLQDTHSLCTIEGLIGAGKSLLLGGIKKYIAENGISAIDAPPVTEGGDKRHLFLVMDEPTTAWCKADYTLLNSRGEGEDTTSYQYLDLFYKGQNGEYATKINPWAFDFQVFAFTTRVSHMCEQLAKLPKFDENTLVHVISERSLRTDRLFFKNLYESGKVPQHQWLNYESFHDIICRDTLKKTGKMVYVNTSPDKSHTRILKRARLAETNNSLPVSYLQSLHNAHQEMVTTFVAEKGEQALYTMNFEQDMTEAEVDVQVAALMQSLKCQ